MRVLGVLLGGVVAAACGARPPPAVENAEALPTLVGTVRVEAQLVAMPRPNVDVSFAVPDFHDVLRWPLTGMNHPTLEPYFPVAQELAIGVDWEQLCARGVHTRVSATQKELLSYLHGWCDVAKRDVDAACAHLTPLLGSVKSGLRPAVRRDLANILVEQGNAEKAEHWLSKHHIRDVQILDLLAANYVEVGSVADAFAINRRAMDSDDHATDATKCMRLAKRIVIGHDHNVGTYVAQFKQLVLDAKVPDATCERLWNKVSCWRERGMCAGYFNDENISPQARLLVDAYDEWPRGNVTSAAWWVYVDKARLALPTPGASELVVTAIEASLHARACTPPMATSFHNAIELVRKAPDPNLFEARLAAIEEACPKPSVPAPPASPPPALPTPASPTPPPPALPTPASPAP